MMEELHNRKQFYELAEFYVKWGEVRNYVPVTLKGTTKGKKICYRSMRKKKIRAVLTKYGMRP